MFRSKADFRRKLNSNLGPQVFRIDIVRYERTMSGVDGQNTVSIGQRIDILRD